MIKRGELINVIPNLLVACVENMRPVPMHLNVRNLFGVAIARYMISLFHDKASFSSVCQFASADRAKQAGAYNQIVVQIEYTPSECTAWLPVSFHRAPIPFSTTPTVLSKTETSIRNETFCV